MQIKMKQNILAELIAGFFKATPKRLAVARNVLVIIAILGGAAVYLSNEGVVAIPEWITNLFSEGGILALLMGALGLQASKKDLNEGVQ